MGWLNRNQKRWIPKYMRRKVNFPLIVGVIIVLLTVLVAVFGPQLAPRDPLEQNQITKVGSKYLIPPFPILTPGFPLGSDQLGRDILSGLLWAVRPTLLLVTFVALIRLLTGTVIGLLAGFQLGRFSRFLDTLISAAISVPTIIVALGCIAALGIDLGVWVFIVGLTLTGWVETARIVREQTNMIRGQVFVEAARSLGASEVSILFNHVLSQIMPMIWMLFAFEISSSLMLTASLGFLGYYVGGDVWVMVSDTTAIATSSMPELGQMLATTKTNLTKPWALFSLGGTIFLIVLGFTMLGEGLRNRLNRASMEQSNRLAQWRENARFWVENSILHPVRKTIRRYPYLAVIAGCIILLAGTIILGTTLWGWYQNTYAEKTIPPSFVSQEAQWVSADHDAYGTLWSRATGPHSTDFAWALSIPGGIEEGPAIGADGTVYVTASEGELLALSPADGSIIWRCALPDVGIGAPGIDAEGTIYVADGDGGVSAIKPDGSLKWYYAPAAINSAETGPVVSRYGLIFYTVRGYLRTITNDGAFLWEAYLQDMEATRMPVRLSPDGSIVYTSNAAFSVLDGSKMAFPNLGDMDGYFTGADGELYAFSGHRILHWSNSTPEGEVKSILTWDFQKFTVSTGPHEAGAAPDGSFWMFYTSFSRKFGLGEDTRVVWLDAAGNILGNVHYGTRNSLVIAIDSQGTMYSCGNLEGGFGTLECQAFAREEEEPLWTIKLDASYTALGGSLADNRLYLSTTSGMEGEDGILYAIGAGAAAEDEVVEPESVEAAAASTATPAESPVQPVEIQDPQVSLLYQDESGLSGNPAVMEDGSLCLPSLSQRLICLDADGNLLWEKTLSGKPVGDVLAAGGKIYVVDETGKLTAFDVQGNVLWEFQSEVDSRKAISGPAISADGTRLYYTVGAAYIQAVSSDGVGLWASKVKTGFFYRTPRPSLDGKYVYFHEEIFDAATGESLPTGLDFQVKEFFDGDDGRHYIFTTTTVVAWTYQGGKVVLSEEKALDSSADAMAAGVSADGMVWISHTIEMSWFTRDGQAIGTSSVENAWLEFTAGMGASNTIYMCGRTPRSGFGNTQPYCAAFTPGGSDPLWAVEIGDKGDVVKGVMLVGDALYVTTDMGFLYMLKDVEPVD